MRPLDRFPKPQVAGSSRAGGAKHALLDQALRTRPLRRLLRVWLRCSFLAIEAGGEVASEGTPHTSRGAAAGLDVTFVFGPGVRKELAP